MSAHVQNASVLVYSFHAGEHLLLQYVELPVEVVAGGRLAVQIVAYLAENPGPSEGGSPHHYGVHSVALEAFLCALGCVDVSVADNGDVDAWVALHFPDQCPVGFARVHLCPSATVYGERLYAAVLQLFCQLADHQMLVVPPQSGLGCDWCAGHCVHHCACYLQHFRYVLQQSCSGTFAGHLLHGATEVEVEHIGPRLLHHDACCLAHGFDVLAVYLDGYGSLVVADSQFLEAFVHESYQCVARYELGIDHGGAHLPAQQSESDVGDVLHRC